MKDKRTAIVTGASRGIGAAIATRLAADSFSVIINHSASADDAEALVVAIQAAGGRAYAVRADITSADDTRMLFEKAEAMFGGVDVLVNNAGILRANPIAEVSNEDFHYQVSVNLNGAFYCMREGARRICDGGRIISLSTALIGLDLPAHGVYVATKSAVESLTRVLAKELGPRGITVNAVAPGPIGTQRFCDKWPAETIKHIVEGIPMGRLGEPQDVASVVSFLTGSDGGWVNGQVIKCNGGSN